MSEDMQQKLARLADKSKIATDASLLEKQRRKQQIWREMKQVDPKCVDFISLIIEAFGKPATIELEFGELKYKE